MKWHHNLVEIAFRNYNSYVYHDTFLKFRLYDELAKVSSRDPRTSCLSQAVCLTRKFRIRTMTEYFQTKVENCNVNFFGGIRIPLPDLTQKGFQTDTR